MTFASFLLFSSQAQALRIIRDAEVENYMQTLINRLIVARGRKANSIKPILVDSPAFNAFVADPSHIYIFVGAILNAKNSYQLSSILAHEFGHISLGHLYMWKQEHNNNLIKAILTGLLASAGMMIAKSGEGALVAIQAIMEMYQADNNASSRGQEISADMFGVQTLEMAKIPPQSIVDIFTILKAKTNPLNIKTPLWIMDHPPTSERIRQLKLRVKQLKTYKYESKQSVYNYRLIQYKLRSFLAKTESLKEIIKTTHDPYVRDYVNIVYLYRIGKTKQSLRLLQNLIKHNKNKPYLYDLAGQISFEGNMFHSALSAQLVAIKKIPNDPMILYPLAQTYMKLKGKSNYKKAMMILEKVLAQDKSMPFIWKAYAVALSNYGKPAQSQLALAHEFWLLNKRADALTLAKKAQKSMSRGSKKWLEAQDIIDISL